MRLVGNARPRTDIHLIIIAPIIGPQTSRNDELALILIRQCPRVLHKSIQTIDRKQVVCLMGEIHLHLGQGFGIAANHIGRMRQSVTGRVEHLPFVHHIINVLMLETQSPLQQALVKGANSFIVKVIDLSIKTVAGMFGERPYVITLNHLAKFLRTERGVSNAELISLLNVVSFRFVCRIGRCYPFHVQVVVGLVRQGQGTQAHGIVVHLLTIEIDLQLQGQVDGAHVDFGGLRNHHVPVFGIIAQKRQIPFAVQLVVEQSLRVGEIGAVIAFGVHHAESQSRILVTHAHEVTELLVFRRAFHMGFSTQKAQSQRASCFARGLVGHIEHGRHLVAILRRKTARRKLYIADQL